MECDAKCWPDVTDLFGTACQLVGPPNYRYSVRVWIDQDLCTGDGLCVDHCPDAFVQLEDGIAYVAERGQSLNDPRIQTFHDGAPFGRGNLLHVVVQEFSVISLPAHEN